MNNDRRLPNHQAVAQQEPPTGEIKAPYERPRLWTYGTLAELTKGTGSQFDDGDGTLFSG